MNLDDHLEICLGHVEVWLAYFVEQYPNLIPAGLFEKNSYPQSSFNFEGLVRTAETLPPDDVEITLINVVKNIDSARQMKVDGRLLEAWSSAMQASRLCGRLQPIEEYAEIAYETDENEIKLKAKAIELFALHRPENGWVNYSQACSNIHEDLVAYFEKIEDRKSPDLDLTRRLKKWKKDLIFRSGFDVQNTAMQERRLERKSS